MTSNSNPIRILANANPHSLNIDRVAVYPFTTSPQEILFSDGKGVNLVDIMIEFNIYESLHSPFITGELILADSLALLTTLPIIGEEVLEFDFYVPHKDLAKTRYNARFRVTGMTNLQNSNNRFATYVLQFQSEEMIFDLARKIQRSWRDKLISEMAKSVYDDYLKSKLNDYKIDIEESDQKRTLVVPNMRPSASLKFFAHDSASSRNRASNYIFYQDRKQFNFKTIEKIIDDAKKKISQGRGGGNASATRVVEYTLRDFNYHDDMNKDASRNSSPIPAEWSKVNNFKVNTAFNKLSELTEGVIENRLVAVDIDKKTYKETEHKFDQGYDELKKIGRSTNPTLSRDSYWKNLTKPSPVWESEIGKIENDNAKHVGDSNYNYLITSEDRPDATENSQRQNFLSLLRQSVGMLNNVSLTLNVPGHLESNIGDIIRVALPEFGGTDDVKGLKNRLISENYLIVSMRHMYNKKNGYVLSLDLVKNSYEFALEGLDAHNNTIRQ